MKHQKLITTPETSARMEKVHLKGSKAEITLAKKTLETRASIS